MANCICLVDLIHELNFIHHSVLFIWLMTCIINFLHEHNSSYSYIIQFHVSENSIHKVNFIDLVTFHPSIDNCTFIVHFVLDISSKCFTHLMYLIGEAYLTSCFVVHVVNFFFKTLPFLPLLMRMFCEIFKAFEWGNVTHLYLKSQMTSWSCFMMFFVICGLVGCASTGTGTIALDPTFGSFTLLAPISH